ncbi:MAG: hypothetical protein ACKVJU_24175 [Verrucomicrobiales bacterium]
MLPTYLTGNPDQHREWICGFKGPSRLMRGTNLIRDGEGNWWDVSKVPANLDNLTKIEDFDSLTEIQREEKTVLDEVLSRIAREDVGGPNLFHEDPSMNQLESELEQMRAKAEKSVVEWDFDGGDLTIPA